MPEPSPSIETPIIQVELKDDISLHQQSLMSLSLKHHNNNPSQQNHNGTATNEVLSDDSQEKDYVSELTEETETDCDSPGLQRPIPTNYPDYRPGDRVTSPLLTPMTRRIEVLSILLHVSSLLLLPSLFFFLWCFPICWPFLIAYLFCFYLFDKSPSNGNAPNRRSEFVRNSKFYEHITNFFPITIHKTVDLKPTFTTQEIIVEEYSNILFRLLPSSISYIFYKLGIINRRQITKKESIRSGPRYLFGYHPHGVIAMGVACGIASEGADFGKIFPGIQCYVTTLINQFMFPFYRDYLMCLGVTAVTKKNIRSLLFQNQSLIIVVGGASESLLAKPGLNSIVLNKRKGFVKTAIEMCGDRMDIKDDDENDICLVPVYAFGENNIYGVYYTNDDSDAIKNKQDGYIKKILKKFQLLLKEHVGFTIPIVISRGVFNYDFGFLPYRRPIDIVFGEPIQIRRFKGLKTGDKATNEEVDYYHKLYIEGLIKVFNENKSKFLTKYDKDLKIVE